MMIVENILVPLDGSSLAEAALPGAGWFSQLYGAKVTLLHVIEHNAPATVHGQPHLTNETDALAYLKSISLRFPTGTQVEFHVHREEVSNVARSIASHASELDQDLVVMCSHGRSGLRQFIVGNIAQQVIGLGKTPVLLVQPQRDQNALFDKVEKLLVALDGNPEHTCGFELAADIVQRSGAQMILLNVVPKLASLKGQEAAVSRLQPVTTVAILDIEEEEAAEMLSSRARPLKDQGLEVSALVRRGDPSELIARTGEDEAVDMVVMTTHGKHGMDAFWSGSVAPRVPGLTDLPLLLVPTCYMKRDVDRKTPQE
jgi:nucleotide-binding universal stress UspA family protein